MGDDLKKADDQSNIPESEKEKKKLVKVQQKFLTRFQETLINFQQTINIMDKQSEQMNRLCEDITSLERNKGAPPVEAPLQKDM